MSGPVSNCPNCGGPIQFRWSGAVQTTCPYCASILVRHDLELERVGVVSDLPAAGSPIQIGTQGRYGDRRFTVTGRIVYEYERGTWSEWHLAMGDGSSGWLSDAQAEYAVTFVDPNPGPLPRADELRPGVQLRRGDTVYEASTLTRARYRGVEGELPFEYWDKEEVVFADFRTRDTRFATVDYSEEPPLLFRGEFVEWDALALTNLRADDETATRVQGTRGLNCPNCGNAVELRDPANAVNVGCTSCGSILDATSPALKLLQRFNQKVRVKPRIPLGTTGTLDGEPYQVLGFQVRGVRVEGVEYAWREYLLHNRARGYRYLTEYNGHWNDVVTLRSRPEEGVESGRPVARMNGVTFRHFQTSLAKTSFVLGEFPWQVRVGDKVTAHDFVDPPRMLSAEETPEETTWSLGTYTAPDKIWQTFKLEGRPPAPTGVFANQPSPHGGSAGRMWKTFGLLLLVFFGILFWRMAENPWRPVLTETHRWAPGLPGEGAVVTQPFELDGRTSAVGVDISTDVSNSWAFFNLALINEETRTAYEVSREISYYHGVDGGERWSEGSSSDDVRIPSVPSGRYVLHVAPEAGAPVNYSLKVERDVPALSFYFIALLLLLVPPVLTALRSGSFETQRWAESDYAASSDDDD